MVKSKKAVVVSDEIVMTKILLIRKKKVMIDRDLAELYGVTTKRLNEQVKRNIKRFPVEFMFQLTAKEKEEVVAKCDHLGALKFSPQLPYVFTEYGAVMLASVLNSERAIKVNIQIVKVFTRMREMLMTSQEILLKLEQVERQTTQNTEDIQSVFTHLRKFLIPPEQANRRRIGFKQQGKGK